MGAPPQSHCLRRSRWPHGLRRCHRNGLRRSHGRQRCGDLSRRRGGPMVCWRTIPWAATPWAAATSEKEKQWTVHGMAMPIVRPQKGSDEITSSPSSSTYWNRARPPAPTCPHPHPHPHTNRRKRCGLARPRRNVNFDPITHALNEALFGRCCTKFAKSGLIGPRFGQSSQTSIGRPDCENSSNNAPRMSFEDFGGADPKAGAAKGFVAFSLSGSSAPPPPFPGIICERNCRI